MRSVNDPHLFENHPAPHDRLGYVRREWRFGRYYGYPVCCIAHYCWDAWWGRPPAIQRTYELWPVPPDQFTWVPCGVFHSAGSGLGIAERLRRIARENWTLLQPTRHGRAMRALARERRLRRSPSL